MRKTSVAVVFAITLVCAMFAGGRSSSASAVASTPTPTPAPHANITVRHTLDGVPFIALADGPWDARVGDSVCGLLHTADVRLRDRLVDVIDWPWPRCSSGSPVSFCYGLAFCSNEFHFDGHDATIDMPWTRSMFPGVPMITARFVHDNQPEPVTILAWSFVVHDTPCVAQTTQPVLITAVVISALSIYYGSGRNPGCGQVGTGQRARFTTQEFGDVEGTFDFASNDVTFDVDVGPSATATPTPSAQVSPSPIPSPSLASLPYTGGQPDTDGVPVGVLAGGLLTLTGAAMLAGAQAGRERRA